MNPINWEASKEKEKSWWKNWKVRSNPIDMKKLIMERADKIKFKIGSYYPAGNNMKILQIGPGGNGEVHFLKGERYAIDPLADFFIKSFPDLIDPNVAFVEGMAENLPYKRSFFDVILFINVLDHCSDPNKTMSEISRCLKNGGLLVFEVNIYNRIFAAIHKLLYRFIDPEHPHAFTKQKIRSLLKAEYQVLEESLKEMVFYDIMNLKRVLLFGLKMFRMAPVEYKVIAKKIS